jgi:hypothetical protein
MMREIQIHLNDLLDALGRSGTKADLEQTARDLSKIADKQPPWTYRYMLSVLNGSLQPSKSLNHAMRAMALSIDGVPELYAKAEPVTVYAPPGAIKEGALLLSASRVCANPFCNIHFVPRVPWQHYHNDDCRREAYRQFGSLDQ